MMTSITEDSFGKTTDGKDVKRFTLSNGHGCKVQVISLGGAVTSLVVPDRDGNAADIITGYDTVQGYERNPAYFGVLVGRFANRIAKGQITVDGQKYQLDVNNGPNHLHGGADGGFSKKLWTASVQDKKVVLELVSEDGDAHYPGQVTVRVTYELTNDNELIISYSASSTAATPINLTNHAYFNLGGHDQANVHDHRVFIYADTYTPKDATNIPTGEIADVTGTMFDLRKGLLMGDSLSRVPLGDPNDRPGYDHNFCTGATNGQTKLVARVEHAKSGRVMECLTDQPGVQFYTANWVENEPGKAGVTYQQHSALCLESQNYPDAPNKTNFPNSILSPGENFNTTTVYKFSHM